MPCAVMMAAAAGLSCCVMMPSVATEFSMGVARDLIGADRVIELPHPVMGAEDFSYVTERLPGTMMFLGGTPLGRDLATTPPNHSNRVFFDEQAMVDGAAIYSAVALRHLASA
jgi:hippurate hydrolase